jgi:phage-related baseplate assembly protein
LTQQNRGYPEISFVNTDTDRLVNALVKSYEKFTGRTLYPADPVQKFILWIADIIIQERILIDESAKQNVPRYAQGVYLDSLAEIFKDAYRLQPQAAATTFRFYLSTALPYQHLIPIGTRIAVDGNIVFETTEILYIDAGKQSGDVPAICQQVGEIGNGFVPGQITQLVDVFPYYDRVENITVSAGGAERETDSAFYERMRESMESFSTAGPSGAYIYHAKTASPLVADVAALSPTPGVADIRVLLRDGELPTEEVLQEVQAQLSADKVRPLCDFVQVSAPDAVPLNIDATYYIPKPSQNSAAVITADVEKAVQDYIRWQTEKMGRDINPSVFVSYLMKTGIKRVVVRQPEYTVVPESEVAALNQCNVSSGGVEDE